MLWAAQKQTSERVRVALPPKADIDEVGRDVRFVSKADIQSQRAYIRLSAQYQRGGDGI